MFPKIGVGPPNHPFVHRVFHDFHHPFWGFYPYFWIDTQMNLMVLPCGRCEHLDLQHPHESKWVEGPPPRGRKVGGRSLQVFATGVPESVGSWRYDQKTVISDCESQTKTHTYSGWEHFFLPKFTSMPLKLFLLGWIHARCIVEKPIKAVVHNAWWIQDDFEDGLWWWWWSPKRGYHRWKPDLDDPPGPQTGGWCNKMAALVKMMLNKEV